jgi:hypothetical protein
MTENGNCLTKSGGRLPNRISTKYSKWIIWYTKGSFMPCENQALLLTKAARTYNCPSIFD